MIVTRIAPSPTGVAHIGTAYTALMNYAVAKKAGGKFYLRIEDTDTKRNVEEGVKAIVDGLSWLGLSWEGKPVMQSDRLDIYKKYARALLEQRKAYEEDGGIIFRVTNSEPVAWRDLIRDEMEFPADQVVDFAIIKKDGFPTYNFAVVVDDHEMGITHVIRAEDHISNTPRQILLYQAFGFNLPEFAHTPLLRNPDRSKISKRKNPIAIDWYKTQGYLASAVVNFLGLLGWSYPGGKEIFDITEYVEKFSLSRVGKTGPVFNPEKLDWLNGEYIRRLSVGELSSKFEFINSKFKSLDKAQKSSITSLVQSRIKTLKEFDQLAGFFFERPKVDKKLLGDNYKGHLEAALSAIQKDAPLDEVPEKHGFKTGKFFMDLRIAVTGSRVTPPINESIAILGKSESEARIGELL